MVRAGSEEDRVLPTEAPCVLYVRGVFHLAQRVARSSGSLVKGLRVLDWSRSLRAVTGIRGSKVRAEKTSERRNSRRGSADGEGQLLSFGTDSQGEERFEADGVGGRE